MASVDWSSDVSHGPGANRLEAQNQYGLCERRSFQGLHVIPSAGGPGWCPASWSDVQCGSEITAFALVAAR
ncbi:MAG: hypothetical protein WCZ48_09900 [Bacillota bacterium]